MLQNLINLARENAGALLNDPAIPADRKDEAVTLAGTSIFNGLQNALSQGNIKEVLNLFSGQAGEVSSHPITQQISKSFTQDLSSKFELGNSQASSLASSLIPSVIGKMVTKTNDPADSSFDLQQMFNQLSAGKTSGLNIKSVIAKIKQGLDIDKDGDVDLQDLKSMFGSEGNILDKVKGMFK